MSTVGSLSPSATLRFRRFVKVFFDERRFGSVVVVLVHVAAVAVVGVGGRGGLVVASFRLNHCHLEREKA